MKLRKSAYVLVLTMFISQVCFADPGNGWFTNKNMNGRFLLDDGVAEALKLSYVRGLGEGLVGYGLIDVRGMNNDELLEWLVLHYTNDPGGLKKSVLVTLVINFGTG